MKKISLGLMLLALIVSSEVSAQRIGNSSAMVVQRSKPAPVLNAETPQKEIAVKAAKPGITAEDVKKITEKELPPVAMTPEQKAEIDLSAKRSLRGVVKAKSIRERKDFIDVMTSAEKVRARRQALLEGKTSDEASDVENDVEKPSVNPSSNRAMEKYIFEKAGLNNEK